MFTNRWLQRFLTPPMRPPRLSAPHKRVYNSQCGFSSLIKGTKTSADRDLVEMLMICECVYMFAHTHSTLERCCVTTGRLGLSFTEDAEKTFFITCISQLESSTPKGKEQAEAKSKQKDKRDWDWLLLWHKLQAGFLSVQLLTHPEATLCGVSYSKLNWELRPFNRRRVSGQWGLVVKRAVERDSSKAIRLLQVGVEKEEHKLVSCIHIRWKGGETWHNH